MDTPKLNDNTSLGINVKWLIQIIVVAAMIVWGYFGLTSKIAQLEIDVLRMKDGLSANLGRFPTMQSKICVYSLLKRIWK